MNLLLLYNYLIFKNEPLKLAVENTMRIRLTLRPQEKKCIIPLNYQYYLSAAIYNILADASPEYAGFLHNRGYVPKQGKPMKLFTFSRLHYDAADIN